MRRAQTCSTDHHTTSLPPRWLLVGADLVGGVMVDNRRRAMSLRTRSYSLLTGTPKEADAEVELASTATGGAVPAPVPDEAKEGGTHGLVRSIR